MPSSPFVCVLGAKSAIENALWFFLGFAFLPNPPEAIPGREVVNAKVAAPVVFGAVQTLLTQVLGAAHVAALQVAAGAVQTLLTQVLGAGQVAVLQVWVVVVGGGAAAPPTFIVKVLVSVPHVTV